MAVGQRCRVSPGARRTAYTCSMRRGALPRSSSAALLCRSARQLPALLSFLAVLNAVADPCCVRSKRARRPPPGRSMRWATSAGARPSTSGLRSRRRGAAASSCVHLESFEGPLDLLLSADRENVTRCHSGLASLAGPDEVLAHSAGTAMTGVSPGKQRLVVAATLLDLSSPGCFPIAELEDEEDLALLGARPAVARLLQYRAYRRLRRSSPGRSPRRRASSAGGGHEPAFAAAFAARGAAAW